MSDVLRLIPSKSVQFRRVQLRFGRRRVATGLVGSKTAVFFFCISTTLFHVHFFLQSRPNGGSGDGSATAVGRRAPREGRCERSARACANRPRLRFEDVYAMTFLHGRCTTRLARARSNSVAYAARGASTMLTFADLGPDPRPGRARAPVLSPRARCDAALESAAPRVATHGSRESSFASRRGIRA